MIKFSKYINALTYIIISLAIIFFGTKLLSFDNELNKVDIQKIYINDIYKNKYGLAEFFKKDHLIIVLYHNYNCFECFKDIKAEIDSILNIDKNFDYLVICRVQNDIITQKKTLTQLGDIFDKSKIYFDIHKSEDKWPPSEFEDGLFSLLDIKLTPTLIRKDYQSIKFIPYIELFPEMKK